MALKISFKQQRKQTKMHSYAMAGKHISQLTLLTNFINRSHICLLYFQFACWNFLILILQLSFIYLFIYFFFYVLLYCFEFEQLPPHNHFWGTKQTVPAKQRKDGDLF